MVMVVGSMIRFILIILLLMYSIVNVVANFALFQVATTADVAPDVTCNFITGVATGTGSGTCVSPTPTCNGVADDTASFDAFATWAIGTWQASHTGLIELDIAAGKNCVLIARGTVTFDGIKKLRIVGYGAQLSGDYLHLGGDAQYADHSHSTRLMTVNAGVSSVTVNPGAATQPSACNSNATCVALFTVGQFALIAGYDLQTGVGFPTNPFYFQYVKVINVNSSTGVITFDRVIIDTYKTTWPNYGITLTDYGGPATLYALKPGWDMEVEWRGLTFISTNQMDATSRSAIFRNTTFPNTADGCPFPTLNSSFVITGSTLSCTIEADKIVEAFTVTNSSIDQINFQNSGIKQFTASGLTIRNMTGTPLASTITNSTVTAILRPGPYVNGRTNSLTVTNSSIAAIGDQSNATIGGLLYKGGADEGINNISGLSMSGGVISIPNAYVTANTETLGWSAPGTNMCWADVTYLCAKTFQILDVTKDGVFSTATISNASPAIVGLNSHGLSAGSVVSFSTLNCTAGTPGTLPSPLTCATLYYVISAGLTANSFEVSAVSGGAAINTTTAGTGPFNIVTGNTYIQTSEGGGLPSWSYTGGKLFVRTHPAPSVTFSNVTGSADAISLSLAPANTPLYSYFKRTFVNADSATAPYWSMWGNISKYNVTINSAYAGATSPAIVNPVPLSATFLTAAYVGTVYNPVINLKSASPGLRALDASGGSYPVSWSGSQSGDTLSNLTQALWAPNLFQSLLTNLSGDSGNPFSVTVEFITNQNLVIP